MEVDKNPSDEFPIYRKSLSSGFIVNNCENDVISGSANLAVEQPKSETIG